MSGKLKDEMQYFKYSCAINKVSLSEGHWIILMIQRERI